MPKEIVRLTQTSYLGKAGKYIKIDNCFIFFVVLIYGTSVNEIPDF